MKTRGERREINHRKWINKLKNLFNSGTCRYEVRKVKTNKKKVFRVRDYNTWDELTNDIWGVMHRNTRTLYRDCKWLDMRDERKRNLTNRSLSKEDKEELEEWIMHIHAQGMENT